MCRHPTKAKVQAKKIGKRKRRRKIRRRRRKRSRFHRQILIQTRSTARSKKMITKRVRIRIGVSSNRETTITCWVPPQIWSLITINLAMNTRLSSWSSIGSGWERPDCGWWSFSLITSSERCSSFTLSIRSLTILPNSLSWFKPRFRRFWYYQWYTPGKSKSTTFTGPCIFKPYRCAYRISMGMMRTILRISKAWTCYRLYTRWFFPFSTRTWGAC